MDLEPVYLAANTGEADDVEDVLDSLDVEYNLRLDTIRRDDYHGPCYQGILYEVPAGRAEECRRRIREWGLTQGLVSTR